MVFQTKKVRTETLSEYLMEVRREASLSIEEVAEKTGISNKFLEYLESGQYAQLPPDVYVMGFLKQLSVVYAISGEALFDQYRRESGIATQVAAQLVPAGKTLKSYFSRLVLTPKLMGLAAAAGFIGLTLIYLVAQLVLVSSAPKLEPVEPVAGQLVQKSFLKISGTTDPGTSLVINDQNTIFVDPQGNFNTTIPVVDGQSDLVMKATNRFAKSTTKRIPIVVNLSQQGSANEAAAQPANNFSLKVDVLQPVTIGLKIDDAGVDSQIMEAGSTRTVTGRDIIFLSTSDAGNTFVSVNGVKIGRLGRPGQNMENIPFSQETVKSISDPMAKAGKDSAILSKN